MTVSLKSLSHVSSMHGIVDEMVRASGSIDESTKDVLVTSDEICQHMNNYVDIMDHAVTDMKTIEQAANLTEEAIKNLESSVMEISGFTNEITEISEQTNLLALNASIEAARAGEHGKGFSVVADEVRVLAERSKQSNSAITVMVSKMIAMLDDVKLSNERNLASVDAGIAQISDARQGAINLGQLQADSRTRIEQIAKDCDQTKQCSEDVREMSDQMEELVKNSQVRASSIVEEANNQSRITGMTEETFSHVMFSVSFCRVSALKKVDFAGMFLVFGAEVLLLCLGKFDFQGLFPVLVGYAAVISFMVIKALSLWRCRQGRERAVFLIMPGGVLFLLSDILLLFWLFGIGTPKEVQSVNWVLYYLAQGCLSASLNCEIEKSV